MAGGPVVVFLEVCDHEVPLGMSPVIQATGRRIVHAWVSVHARFLNLPLQHHHFGPREDAARWNHRTFFFFDVEFDLAASERLESMEVVDIKASPPLVTV